MSSVYILYTLGVSSGILLSFPQKSSSNALKVVRQAEAVECYAQARQLRS